MGIKTELRTSARVDKVEVAIGLLPPSEQAEVREVILDPNYSYKDIADWLTSRTVRETGNPIDRKQVAHHADKLKRKATT